MVQDLGLNLYTSLSRVLVEFVANAHDADSPYVDVSIDADEIQRAQVDFRARAKQQHEEQTALRAAEGFGPIVQAQDKRAKVPDAATPHLPDSLWIEIRDEGHGMSRGDIQNKFLIAGRRRRQAEGLGFSQGGRIIMGRKGLGKLAGFGVAQVMVVTSRVRGSEVATQFTLDFLEISKHEDIHEVSIPEQELGDQSILPNGGTIVRLMSLYYEPTKASLSEISEDIASHFYLVTSEAFDIRINGKSIAPAKKEFAYAYPAPDLPVDQLIMHTIEPDEGEPYDIEYRLRFVTDRSALFASQRGVRVYTHQRLAAMPSLLGADTNMHGFRMTDYLDGIVSCNAIDDQEVDLVATDRQGLRWDTPMLAPLYDFLSAEIREACKHRQKARDQESEERAKEDTTVTSIVETRNLSKREAKTFRKIAAAVSSGHKKGFEAPEFKGQLEVLADAYVQGNLFEELTKLAAEGNPEFGDIASKVVKLTSQELDAFFKFCRARLSGIEALRRIVRSTDFKAPKNEGVLHDLLNKCPWLIDPTFFEFLSSDVREGSMLKNLERELEIGPSVPEEYDRTTNDEAKEFGSNKRPDLVFVIGSAGLKRIVIVELKAPNTPLHADHLQQLEGYIARTLEWTGSRSDLRGAVVHGYLIGSHAAHDSRAEKVITLRYRMNKFGPESNVHVLGIDEMLERAGNAHKEILEVVETLDSESESN